MHPAIVPKLIEEMNLRNLGCIESVIEKFLTQKMNDLSAGIDFKLNKLDEDKPMFDKLQVFQLTNNAIDATVTICICN